MPDDVEYPARGYTTQDIRSVTTPPEKRRRWGLWLLTALIVAPAALLALWAAITLNVTYSRGERAGIVQKFSRKGWLCKTWEGEIAMATIPGAVPERFAFTVRDDSVARLVNALYREGARASIAYEQHRGVPTSCFGETQYFAVGAEAIGGVTPGALRPPAPAAAPPTAAPPAAPPATAPSAAGSTPPSTPSPTPPAATPPR
jgi:hypothetical protein